MFSGSMDDAKDSDTSGWTSFGSASHVEGAARLDISPIAWTGSNCQENFGALAVGAVTFLGTLTDGSHITLISTDGTSKTYEADSGGAANGDIINTDKIAYVIHASNETTSENFIEAVNHENGHDGKIVATDHAFAAAAIVTQAVQGTDGNTTITENDDSIGLVQFTGGIDGEGSGSVSFVLNNKR